MTLIEAARKMTTTPDNLRRAIAAGTLRATKRGRDWYVTQAAVDSYMRDHRRVPGVPRGSRTG